jgi:hypothetical protein
MRHFPWHPPVLALLFILFNVIDTGVHVHAGGRALVVALLVACAVQISFSLLLRNRHAGALVTTALIAIAVFWVPIRVATESVVRLELVTVLASLVLVASALTVVTLSQRRRVRLPSLRSTTDALNGFSLVLTLVVIGTLATSPMLAQLPRDLLGDRVDARSAAEDFETAPDVYVILLDGHPRRDSLLEQTGHDVQPFLGALEQQGLDVVPHARSNYDWTGATLTSLLDMELLGDDPELAPPKGPPRAPYVIQVRNAVNENRAFDVARSHGYEIIGIGSAWEHVALRSADRFEDAGYVNSFECHLIRRTVIGHAAWTISPRLLGDPRRDGLQRSLRILEDLSATQVSHPRFIFAHLPAPHLPVLWDRTGKPIDDPQGSDCAPQFATGLARDELKAALLESLDYVDQLVLETVETVLRQSDEPPVLLVLSDHGAHIASPALTGNEAAAWRDAFAILLAASLPGAEALPRDVSLVNVLPHVFNAYLGTELPLHANESFWPDGTPARAPDLGHPGDEG